MPQSPRSESASEGSGFSWKPWMRPSASWMTTPYSRVSEHLLDGEGRDAPARAVALYQPADVQVGEGVARDDHHRSSPKKSATLRTPPAVPSSSSSKRYSRRSPK